MTKIIDIIKEPREDGKAHLSVEYFPPRTEDGVKKLYDRMERMRNRIAPVFSDITWGAGGSTADLTQELAHNMHKAGHLVNMHMTCTNMVGEEADPKGAILKGLETAITKNGITNIVALRGDPPVGQETWKAVEGGFECALDLVKFIKEQEQFASTVGISVAGYPEGHPNVIKLVSDVASLSPTETKRVSSFDDGKTFYVCSDEDYEKELTYLKEKIDAGGDLIITQMFFDSSLYHQFVSDCRRIGIKCPIVPGIMCINNYAGFIKMAKFCKTRVPEEVRAKMNELQNANIETIQQYGIEFGVQMCKDLMSDNYQGSTSEPAPVLHFYTLNLEKVVYGILEKLEYIQPLDSNGATDE